MFSITGKSGFYIGGALFLAALVFTSGMPVLAQASSDYIGSYSRSFMGASGRVDQVMTINADGTVVWVSVYQNNPQPVIQTGRWSLSGNQLVVDLRNVNGRSISDRLVFEKRAGTLTATDYNREIYGSSGVVFPSGQEALVTPPYAVTGTVTYRERMALSPTARVIVSLVDASIVDVPARVISQQVIRPGGSQVPFAFSLPYDPTKLAASNTYLIKVRIEDAGSLLFATTRAYPVITGGNPTTGVNIVLQRM